MKRLGWPLIATAVGVLVTLAMIAWLGLWWQVNLSALQGWQTLMSAFLAIAAASIAYRAATAKVELDREIWRESLRSKRAALLYRLAASLGDLQAKAADRESALRRAPYVDSPIKRSDLVLPDAPELEEAWQHLDLFPPEAIPKIEQLRRSLRSAEMLLSGVPRDPFDDLDAARLGTSFEPEYRGICVFVVKMTLELQQDMHKALDLL
jgi:hypothetical protein